MKGNEEASARALENLLRKLQLGCTWKAANPENDFPDFEFTVTIDGLPERWAVECVDLHQYIDHNGNEQSRVGVDRRLERLCEGIRRKASPGLNRRYLITALGPTFGVPAKEIERRAIEYIGKGTTEHEALDTPEVTDVDPSVRATKQRVANENARVHIKAILEEVPIVYLYGVDGTVLNGDGKALSSDIEATLRYSLKRILDDKLPKLAHCGSFDRRMLLAWNGYWVAEPKQFKAILHEMGLKRSDLDTFLLVQSDGTVHWVADPARVFAE